MAHLSESILLVYVKRIRRISMLRKKVEFCKLVQLNSHAIAEETTEARVKDYSKVHKRMTRQKGAKIAATEGKFWTGAKIQ